MKKFLILMFLPLLCLSACAKAADTPTKIARLPIMTQKIKLDSDTSAELEVKMARAVFVPANKALNISEYIPPKDSAKALNKIWKKMYAKDKNAKMSDAIKVFAEEIDADLVVCPILYAYSQIETKSKSNNETNLKSEVVTGMFVYEKSTDNMIYKKVTREYNNNYNKYGTASYLAGECFDQLIKDTGLDKIIHNKKD